MAPVGLSPLEVAAGLPIGLEPRVPLPVVTRDPMAALVEVVSAAVRRPPCCVAFSGGRDSSLLLAAAMRASEEQGSPHPVAVTIRYPHAPATDEREWQELVLDWLGVDQRIVIEVTDELDFVGPIAQGELARRGVVFPPNSHTFAPLLPHAVGGSLLVGVGGDELLDNHRWTPLNDVLAGRRRPEARDAARLAVALLPGRIRGRTLERRTRLERPWLQPRAAREVRALERRAADEPLRFDRAVEREARSRVLTVSLAGFGRLGEGAKVSIEAPLLDSLFVAALARAGGARGWGHRVATMQAIATGALPEALLQRRDKAEFNLSFFGEATRTFARDWSGGGLDTAVVDPDALRRVWRGPDPDFRSAMLLQQAWLHDHPPRS